MKEIDARSCIRSWFDAALGAAEPAAAVRRVLARDERALTVGGRRVPITGKLIVVGFGKAAVAMARGAEAASGDLIDGGLVITKDGHAGGGLPERIRVREAAHPIPDERGVAATRELLALLSGLHAGDVVLALISGGGSALLEAPRPPLTLADVASTTDLLLRAGAPIQDLNAVRIPLSLVKGGGLRRAAGDATMVTLILSDVLSNDPRIIASGPTLPGAANCQTALALLATYGVTDRVPPVVVATLGAASRQPPSNDHPDDVLEFVADNRTALGATRAAAEGDGFRSRIIWTGREGEAAGLGRAWIDECRAAGGATGVLLGGGEATVTVHGGGSGGRNTEFTLAAALALEACGEQGWMVASLATDGQDGATGVAGAIADGGTAERARTKGVDPVAALADNDSLRVFQAAGGVVDPGPTGTNVNDLYFAVRRRCLPGC